MYPMRNHDIWIYVRCANSDPRIAFDRLYDLIDEAAGHGFLVRGTSFDHCSGNTLKDRILRFLQNYSAVLITTETNLQYELYLTGLDARLLRRHNRKPIYYVECEER